MASFGKSAAQALPSKLEEPTPLEDAEAGMRLASNRVVGGAGGKAQKIIFGAWAVRG